MARKKGEKKAWAWVVLPPVKVPARDKDTPVYGPGTVPFMDLPKGVAQKLLDAAAGESVTAKEHLCPTGEIPRVKLTTLVVYRALPVNRRIVEAHPPGKPGQIKVVRVQDNSNFMKGMVLEARHVAGQTFELVGGLPRWRGKWGLPGKVDLWRPPVEKKLTPAELKTKLRAKYGREGELI